MKYNYSGGCHCGNIEFEFQSDIEPVNFRPRTCDCLFCRRHGASYVSDSNGSLRIKIQDKSKVSWYRQGSKSAKFIVCAKCGVAVGVVYSENETLFASINANAVTGNERFGKKEIVSPRKLDVQKKRFRWSQIWFADVSVS